MIIKNVSKINRPTIDDFGIRIYSDNDPEGGIFSLEDLLDNASLFGHMPKNKMQEMRDALEIMRSLSKCDSDVEKLMSSFADSDQKE